MLERLARALELDADEREVMFLLAHQRPPPLRPSESALVTPALQRVLDALANSPAIVKTPAWDIVAWNRAATAVLADYAALPADEPNVLRRLFAPGYARNSLPDWEADARFAIAVFRVDAARAGDCPKAAALATELQATSADFRRLWAANEHRSNGVGQKRLEHPVAGALTLEYSAFSVDNAKELTMVVFTPTTPADALAIEVLLTKRSLAKLQRTART